MLTMNPPGIAISIAGGVKDMVQAQFPRPFFGLFFYQVFIVSRYEKPRPVLAMEKTKPIKQNKQ